MNFNPGPLDTLAQPPTIPGGGGGSDVLRKRARSKYYTNRIVYNLLLIDSPLHKQYQRAYYCNSTILQKGQTFTAKYCNSRVCHICNRIRTAKFINGYKEPLEKLGQLEFTTLTIPNVKATQLNDAIKVMCKNLTNILRVLREKKKIPVSGIRKIECTYNSDMDTYHPHFHIASDYQTGEMIISEWLKRYPKATRAAQDTKLCKEGTLLELFKYATKIATKCKKGQGWDIHISALDVIMQALDKKRTFQSFGNIKKVSEDIEELQSQIIETAENVICKIWSYNDLTHDWHNLESNYEVLTGYQPPDIQLNIYI